MESHDISWSVSTASSEQILGISRDLKSNYMCAVARKVALICCFTGLNSQLILGRQQDVTSEPQRVQLLFFLDFVLHKHSHKFLTLFREGWLERYVRGWRLARKFMV